MEKRASAHPSNVSIDTFRIWTATQTKKSILRSVRKRRVQYYSYSTAFARIARTFAQLSRVAFRAAALTRPGFLPFQPRKQEFINALLHFLRESRLTAILFLSGVDMSNRTDEQMMFVAFKVFA